MWRFSLLAVFCAAIGGCSIGGAPPLSSFGLGGDGEEAYPKPAAVTAPAEPAPGHASLLSNVWDNFSAAFRSGAQRAAADPQAQEKLDGAAALRLVNAYRAKNGEAPLKLEARVTEAAALLAEDMAKHNRMSHFGPSNEGVGERLTLSGYPWHLAAENIGAGQRGLEEMIGDWEKSPPHRRNMLLAGAKDMGIAVAYNPAGPFKTYWTLVVAAP